MVLLLFSGVYLYMEGSKADEKYVVLNATFKMGGIQYIGYKLEESKLIFMFERRGDFFTQALESREVRTDEKIKNIDNVLMEVNTNGNIKMYECKFVGENIEELKYVAEE